MSPNPGTPMIITTATTQAAYTKDQAAKGESFTIALAGAFIRSMRDLGYKSPAWAIAEFIDNAIQAAATALWVEFGPTTENGYVSQIAVADNGNGMIPEMMPYAVTWGGTDRENDRSGMGKYGQGLPSAAVSMAEQYTLYSKTEGQDWHAVQVNIRDIAATAGDSNRLEALLTAVPKTCPGWFLEARPEFKNLTSGTVIVLESLDYLHKTKAWSQPTQLKQKLLKEFGRIYRHLMTSIRLVVDGTPAQVVDPLFLMEQGMHFDATPVHAQKVDAAAFEVPTGHGEEKGVVLIRASLLPPTFQLVDPNSSPKSGKKHTPRLNIMKQNHGLMICRQGRFIDTVKFPDTITKLWVTYDRNIKIEIDFDASLDEHFGVTTSKQQITVSDAMWDRLAEGVGNDNGGQLKQLVKEMRARLKAWREEFEEPEVNAEHQAETDPAIEALQVTEKFKQRRPAEPSEKQQQVADANLDRAVQSEPAVQEVVRRIELLETQTEELGETDPRLPEIQQQLAESIRELEKEQTRHRQKYEDQPFGVEFVAGDEGPFYRPQKLGRQKKIMINMAHPFYTRLYAPASKDSQACLRTLLLVLAEAELDAMDETEEFYRSARNGWSERLRYALSELQPVEEVVAANEDLEEAV